MDEVEQRCHDLTAAARRKQLLEESVKNANYMQMVHDPSKQAIDMSTPNRHANSRPSFYCEPVSQEPSNFNDYSK